jgi:hypothetical protein
MQLKILQGYQVGQNTVVNDEDLYLTFKDSGLEF